MMRHNSSIKPEDWSGAEVCQPAGRMAREARQDGLRTPTMVPFKGRGARTSRASATGIGMGARGTCHTILGGVARRHDFRERGDKREVGGFSEEFSEVDYIIKNQF